MADDPRQPSDDPGADAARVARNGEPEAAGPGTPSTGTDASPAGQPDQPGADATQPVPPRAPAWSGRAGVPIRGTGAADQPPPADWSYGDELDDRRWWMPIVVGVVALVLLVILVVAGWAIIESARRTDPRPPTPAVTSPVAPTRPTTAPPTTAPRTTAAPTPSTTSVAPVLVPPLVGLSEQEASERLERLGLVPRIRLQTSGRPAGTVLDTDPSIGAEVAPGGEVTLVVAAPPPVPTTPPGPTGPTQPTPGG